MKNFVAPKIQGEQRCGIKGGGQGKAVMVL